MSGEAGTAGGESVGTPLTVAAAGQPPESAAIEHLFGTVSPVALAVQQSFDDLRTPLSEVTFVVLDVETTGGSPTTSSLTEVAAARYRGGEMLGTFQTLVKPDERIPPFITALTGISNLMVADAPTVGAMLPSFLEFVGGAVVVGHNVRFDLAFLNHALVSTGRDPLDNANVDTLALARRLVRDMVPDCKLGTLAASLDLSHRPSHRALSDVLATGDLLHHLLERAGSFGILGLEELLDLPRLVGHPQAAKLRLTTRLPHRPGVYWFTDAASHVLYVGKATDLHARARSYFTGDRRPKIGRLLRQLHAIHYGVCLGPLTAAVLEGRLIRAWSPPFNRLGKVRRRNPGAQGRPEPAAGQRRRIGNRPGRRRKFTADELAGDPIGLLMPMANEVVRLAQGQWYEDAARMRDEIDRLRHLMGQHRRVEALRRAGRLVLWVEGEGAVELEGGLLMESDTMFGSEGEHGAGPVSGSIGGADAALAMTKEGHDQERLIVAQWLHAHPEQVRVLAVESARGLSLPADRIPGLNELCGLLKDHPVLAV
jgi:DNA polymerase III epsilon subunit family exonuclease